VTNSRGDPSGQLGKRVGARYATETLWVGPATKPKEGLEAWMDVAV
jgi:hypothetical protein